MNRLATTSGFYCDMICNSEIAFCGIFRIPDQCNNKFSFAMAHTFQEKSIFGGDPMLIDFIRWVILNICRPISKTVPLLSSRGWIIQQAVDIELVGFSNSAWVMNFENHSPHLFHFPILFHKNSLRLASRILLYS